jgi:hypothetical protein
MFHERARLRWEMAASNFLNHPNWANPSTDMTDSSFGVITSDGVLGLWRCSAGHVVYAGCSLMPSGCQCGAAVCGDYLAHTGTSNVRGLLVMVPIFMVRL